MQNKQIYVSKCENEIMESIEFGEQTAKQYHRNGQNDQQTWELSPRPRNQASDQRRGLKKQNDTFG